MQSEQRKTSTGVLEEQGDQKVHMGEKQGANSLQGVQRVQRRATTREEGGTDASTLDPHLNEIGPRRLPKIVVFSCAFGGGHKAAANAVSGYLEGNYEVKVVDTSSLTGFSKGNEVMAMALQVFNEFFIAQKHYMLSNAIDTVSKTFGKKLDGPCPSPRLR